MNEANVIQGWGWFSSTVRVLIHVIEFYQCPKHVSEMFTSPLLSFLGLVSIFSLSSSSWSHILHFKAFIYFNAILCCIRVLATLYLHLLHQTQSFTEMFIILTSYTSVLFLPCFVSSLISEFTGRLKQYSTESVNMVLREMVQWWVWPC